MSPVEAGSACGPFGLSCESCSMGSTVGMVSGVGQEAGGLRAARVGMNTRTVSPLTHQPRSEIIYDYCHTVTSPANVP